MLIIRHCSLALVIALQTAAFVSAQGLSEKVWAVFAYTLHGDSTPSALPRPETLTPYGASELYTAGSTFRDRYVATHSDGDAGSRRIQDISPDVLDSEEVIVLSTMQQPDFASAQAFMQGLYPPLEQSENSTYPETSSLLANGSLAVAPLGGYQYPRVLSYGLDDPKSLALAGKDQCPKHDAEVSDYQSGEEFQRITQETEAFYIDLWNQALSGVYDRSSATYKNAYNIAEYLEYELVHNETLMHNLVRDDIKRARYLADQYLFATNGRTPGVESLPSVGPVCTVAGRTLGTRILEAFDTNIQYFGTVGKMSLAFGGPEPIIALASLMKLSARYGDHYPRPDLGGSLIFELYSLENSDDPVYPESSQLFVRFLLHNGTDYSSGFTTYPLFGHGPSSIEIPYNEFKLGLEEFSLQSSREWCLLCESPTLFCAGILSNSKQTPTTKHDGSMDPKVAGGIGAVVTFVVFASLTVLVCLVAAFMKRKSGRGGFKGDRRMTSDTDVTFKNPVWGDGKGNQEPGTTAAGGHGRLGSWEMTENKERNGSSPNASPAEAMPAARSPFGDDNDDELLIHSVVEPAKARECV